MIRLMTSKGNKYQKLLLLFSLSILSTCWSSFLIFSLKTRQKTNADQCFQNLLTDSQKPKKQSIMKQRMSANFTFLAPQNCRYLEFILVILVTKFESISFKKNCIFLWIYQLCIVPCTKPQCAKKTSLSLMSRVKHWVFPPRLAVLDLTFDLILDWGHFTVWLTFSCTA